MHCTCISSSLSARFYPYILSVKASRLDARRLLATTTRFLVIYGLSYSKDASGRLEFYRGVPFCHFEKFFLAVLGTWHPSRRVSTRR